MNEIKNIFIEGTAKTPQVDFNQLTGELILFGKSIPENAAKIYEPLVFWVNDYILAPRKITNFRLNLEYFNTSTSIWIAKIVKTLSRISIDEAILFIHVYFDLEDFEGMDIDDLKDIVFSLVGNIAETKVSIGIKTYGTDGDGKIITGSTIIL